MNYQHLIVTKNNEVQTIVMNRPEVMNALNTLMQNELQHAFDDYQADSQMRICVLTGSGARAFCAGSDLKEIAATARSSSPRQYPRSGYGGIAERFDLTKPTIAAVNGIAFGGGFEVALACDLIIASESARFGLPEPKVGGMALAGGVHRLARQIGFKKALEMILTGRTVDARRGEILGFVNVVAQEGQLQAAVDDMVNEILACSPAAIGASLQAVYRGLDEPSLAAAIRNQIDYPAYQHYLAGPDRAEGPRAFAEKRKPNWVPYEF